MVIILDDLTRVCNLHNVISEGTFGGNDKVQFTRNLNSMSLPLRETCPVPRAVKKEYLSCFLKWKEICWKLQKKHMELHSHCIFLDLHLEKRKEEEEYIKLFLHPFFFSLQNCTRTVGAFKLSGNVVTTKLELHKIVLWYPLSQEC